MELNKKDARKVFITAILAGSLIALTLLVFESFESAVGHGIAIASFGATALIVVFNPSAPGATPKAVFLGYLIAGGIGLLLNSFLVWPAYLMAGLTVFAVSLVQLTMKMVHPPAVAYSLSYVYGSYTIVEWLLTIPAVLGFFIAFGVLAFMLGIIDSIFSHDDKHDHPLNGMTLYQKVEWFIDTLIPYVLVALFCVIILELVNPALMERFASVLKYFDWFVIIIFITDLIFKYRSAKSMLGFFKNNWLDIMATLPVFIIMRFSLAFASVFRLEAFLVGARAGSQVTSMSKLLKPVARFPRFAKLIEKIEGGD